MKRIYFWLTLLLLGSLYWHDTKLNGESLTGQPIANTKVDTGIYITSVTCATSVSTNAVVIANKSATLYRVNVTSAGVGIDASVKVFDSATTTTGVRQITPPINSKTLGEWDWEVYAATGITVNNIGGACIAIVYRER